MTHTQNKNYHWRWSQLEKKTGQLPNDTKKLCMVKMGISVCLFFLFPHYSDHDTFIKILPCVSSLFFLSQCWHHLFCSSPNSSLLSLLEFHRYNQLCKLHARSLTAATAHTFLKNANKSAHFSSVTKNIFPYLSSWKIANTVFFFGVTQSAWDLTLMERA